jgi:hypothetical protein
MRRRLTRNDVDRELRSRLGAKGYPLLLSRLTGAVKAIDTLAREAPDLLPLLLSEPVAAAAAKATLPHDIQYSLNELLAALLDAAAHDRAGHVDRRKLLRLVKRVTS